MHYMTSTLKDISVSLACKLSSLKKNGRCIILYFMKVRFYTLEDKVDFVPPVANWLVCSKPGLGLKDSFFLGLCIFVFTALSSPSNGISHELTRLKESER